MKLVVSRSTVCGTAAEPQSKSHTNRAFILAALADGRSRISSPLMGGDTCATLDAVAALGAEVSISGDSVIISSGWTPPFGKTNRLRKFRHIHANPCRSRRTA